MSQTAAHGTEVVAGSSLRLPMAFEDFLALGETKHYEYYDGLCIVDPPNRAMCA
jgi:hypothetical protein